MQDLSTINYQKYIPSPPLDEYVQAIWLAKQPNNRQLLPFNILSDCAASVVYNFSSSLTLERGGVRANVDHNGVVIGPGKNLLKMTFQGPVNALGIHFLASGGHVFFSQTMDVLANRFISGNGPLFSGAQALTQQLIERQKSGDVQNILAWLEQKLLAELKEFKGHAQIRLTKLFKLLEENPNYSLRILADTLQVSVREVQRIFKLYVGVTPKTYLRVNKINNLKSRIVSNDFASLTELAIESGYFDQAHFIREFKLFMQTTPGQYQKLKQS